MSNGVYQLGRGGSDEVAVGVEDQAWTEVFGL